MVLCVVLRAIEILDGFGLRVLADNDLSGESVGVVHDVAKQASQQVGVGSAALGPLIVDLDHDHIIRGDYAVRSGQRRHCGRLEELQPLAAHEQQQVIQPQEAITRRLLRCIEHVKDVGPVRGPGAEHGALVRVGAAEVTPHTGGQEQARCRHRNARRCAQPGGHTTPNGDQCADQRCAEREGSCGHRRLLARIGQATRLGPAAQQHPAQGKESADQRTDQHVVPQEAPAREAETWAVSCIALLCVRTIASLHRCTFHECLPYPYPDPVPIGRFFSGGCAAHADEPSRDSHRSTL